MSGRRESGPWLDLEDERGAGPPPTLARLLRAEVSVSDRQREVDVADETRLNKVLAGVAVEVARPELVDCYRLIDPATVQTGSPPGGAAASQATEASGAGDGTAAPSSVSGSAFGGTVKFGVVLLAAVGGLSLALVGRDGPAAPAEATVPLVEAGALHAATTPGVPARPTAPAPKPGSGGVEAAPSKRETFEGSAGPAGRGGDKRKRSSKPAAKDPGQEPGPRSGGRVEGPGDALAELSLLQRAQRELRQDPRQALALAQRHKQRYPRGQFLQEREMIAIEALLQLGRRAQARRRGRIFSRRFPSSSHVTRLAHLLAEPP